MSHSRLSVLVVGGTEALMALLRSAAMVAVEAPDGSSARQHDALLYHASTQAALVALSRDTQLRQVAFDSAVVVSTGVFDETLETEMLNLGVQAVVGAADTTSNFAQLPRAIAHAVLRKRFERAARNAYATDLATGLPHQAQLLEHMTQLLALREREPAPMVLIVLRIEGYASAATLLGIEAANILRRKVAVRLRAGLRASDVVAAIGPDAFGVLLGHLEAPADGERVAAKLVAALQQPFVVATQSCAVATSIGLALYPEHGRSADVLLQRAIAQAASVATMGREGFATFVERGPAGSANDEAG